MSASPETRPSILLRLRDRSDHEAWRSFEAIYRPLILRAARSQGLQDADARDVAQSVLMKVTDQIAKFQPDSNRARFRTWLATVTRHVIVDHRRAQGRHPVTVATDATDQFAKRTDVDDIENQIDTGYQREVFRWAASVIRSEFSSDAWQAFWQTAVVGRSVAETASALGKSTGAIYTSRSRIMRRLRDQVCQFDEQLETDR